MATSRRAPRRSTEEVREVILATATKLFTERGYAQTSMRDIAAEASMSLSVLYRQFENKDDLFSATLLAPFLKSFQEFAAAWSSQLESPWGDEQLIGEFVRDLYLNLTENRQLLITLLAAGESDGSNLLQQTEASLTASLTDLQVMAAHEADRRHWFKREQVAVSNSLMLALVTGLVLIRPLLTQTPVEDDEAMIKAATRLAMYGMSMSPGVDANHAFQKKATPRPRRAPASNGGRKTRIRSEVAE
jgi:AcrR family transcriptional regulator